MEGCGVKPLIDVIGKEKAEPLRTLAGLIGASDDTAVMAWAAWQTFAAMGASERTQALSIVIALEEIKRRSEGLSPMFKVAAR